MRVLVDCCGALRRCSWRLADGTRATSSLEHAHVSPKALRTRRCVGKGDPLSPHYGHWGARPLSAVGTFLCQVEPRSNRLGAGVSESDKVTDTSIQQSTDGWYVQGDIDGDGGADFALFVATATHTLSEADFLLV